MKKIALSFSLICCCFVATHAQLNMSFVSNVDFPERLNDVWGYADAQGNEYALVGSTNSLYIFDVTNAAQPQQLFRILGDTSIWRDIKTFGSFAYVSNDYENSNHYPGLLIIDLGNLPSSINTHWWTADSLNIQRAHNLWIDEFGYLYVCGNNKHAGVSIFDLNGNPTNPTFVGAYTERYVHDLYTRDNMMYASEISDGTTSIIDLNDRSNPSVLAQFPSPRTTTHNCWLNDSSAVLFTTDETVAGSVAAYDITDFQNIQLLDQFYSSPGDSVIPHNVHVINDFLVTSYYRDGVVITDAHKADNLVEVGNFDTSPFPSGPSFNGCWGAYPFLPSGLVLATDREEGLFVLNPNYKRACYLEGTVTNLNTQLPLNEVLIEIMGTDRVLISQFDGSFKGGVAEPGIYSLRLLGSYCETEIIPSISLQSGQVTEVDLNLDCNYPIPSALNGFKDQQVLLTLIENPIRSQLNLSLDKNLAIKIYNSNGKLAHNDRLERGKQHILFKGPAGLYYLVADDGEQQQIIKFIKP